MELVLENIQSQMKSSRLQFVVVLDRSIIHSTTFTCAKTSDDYLQSVGENDRLKRIQNHRHSQKAHHCVKPRLLNHFACFPTSAFRPGRP